MSERIIYSQCPLCQSEDFSAFRVGNCSVHPLYDKVLSPEINWMRCAACSHVFTVGYYSEAYCRIIFGKTNNNQRIGADLEKNRDISARMIEKVLPYQSAGIWLDVGFGNGSLLFTAQEYGFTPVGLDVRSENVDILNSLSIAAFSTSLAEFRLEEKCAVISMADVLEHMPFPQEALKAAQELLEEDGVLLISMPNSENILWEIMSQQNTNPYWGELEHYHNFSRTRLYSLLAEHGFSPARYGISERYRVCMEVVAVKVPSV